MTAPRCRAKTFPCPAGERCPQHRDLHGKLDYSIQQADFNQFLDIKNKLLPAKPAITSRTITIKQSPQLVENYAATYKAYAETLTYEQRAAAYQYTENNWYSRINTRLRLFPDNLNWTSTDAMVVENLDTITRGTYQRPNPDTPLWRAVAGEHARQAQDHRVGSIITEPGYTSTTGEPAALDEFIDQAQPVLYQIFTKRGVPVSRWAESEYLLPRGMRFKVVARTRANIEIGGSIRTRSYKNALLLTLHEVED